MQKKFMEAYTIASVYGHEFVIASSIGYDHGYIIMTSGRRRLINMAYSATSTESLRGSVGSIRAAEPLAQGSNPKKPVIFYDFSFFHKFLPRDALCA